MPILSSGDLIADRRFEYARHYAAGGDAAAAADLFRQTLERVPEWLPAMSGLADAVLAVGGREEAIALLEAVADRDPDDIFGARLKLAAVGRIPVPPAPSAAYVRGLFDDYAGRFDTALVEALEYRVPWRLGELLSDLRPPFDGVPTFAHVLDLGCGTGLMGEVLRGRAGRLEGVDLSPEMVERARRKSVYDRLAVGDLAAELASGTGRCDLVVAADVLTYMGFLDEVIAAVAARLSPGGLFAFSVEAADTGDVVLQPSLRYAHGADYLARLAHAAGFVVVRKVDEPIRKDRGEPVRGHLFVLERVGPRPPAIPLEDAADPLEPIPKPLQ